MTRDEQIKALEKDWAENPRWKNVKRGYSAADVVRLRGSIQPEYTLARRGAEKLWDKVNGSAKKGYVNAFGAITAGQAMQQAKAGLEAVYLSGWQVAARALGAGRTCPSSGNRSDSILRGVASRVWALSVTRARAAAARCSTGGRRA